MTVFENVAFGLRMQNPAAEITPRVMEALRMVQLETFAQRKPHRFWWSTATRRHCSRGG